MRRFPLRALIGIAVPVMAGCGVLQNVNAGVSRDFDDDDYDRGGPDAMIDMLGEPDSWDHRKEGDRLLMTATWDCVEGEHREVTWLQRLSASGQQYWSVVEDIARDCDES